ncbi:MAG: hypothetical protein JSR71_08195 [Proteobacteria bacterium]|nr:hypothetical protein [Pseudomonadota bacterium]
MNNSIPIFDLKFEEIHEEITRLASELHSRRTMDLVIKISNPGSLSKKHIDGLFYIEGSNLSFFSIAARNHCTAVHSFQKLGNSDALLNVQEIFDEAHQLEIDEIGHTDFASGRFLGLISQKIDVLKAGTEVINASEARYVFNVLRNIGNALPFLREIKIQSLVDLAKVQYQKTGRDFAATMFFNQLDSYLSNHHGLARNLYTFVRNQISTDNTGLYRSALIGMARAGHFVDATELALSDTASECTDLLPAALWALGCLKDYWGKESELKNRVQQALKAMGHHSDSNVSLQAWRALANAAVSQPELVIELLKHVQPNNQSALLVLSDFAFMNFKVAKDHPNFSEILDALTGLDADRTNDFDYVLSQLIEINSHGGLVYASLTNWVVKHYDSRNSDEKLGSCFGQSIRELIGKPLLHELITHWLISDERILGAAFHDLIGHLWVHEVRQPVFAKDILDTLTTDDFKYLARRLLGWTFHEEALLALTFSLLNTQNAQQRTFNLVYTLLVEEMGRNYPQSTLETIQEKLKDASPEEKRLLEQVQAELLTYTEAIKQLPVRHEFRPPIPMRIRHAVALKKAREQREATDKANDKSTLQQLFTKIPLKAGTGCFSLFQGKISDINRLGSFSCFISLPAQYVVDPLNDEIKNLGFRSAKRGDQ